MTTRADFDRQFEQGQIGLLNHSLETEAQRFRIDSCHLADPNADFARILSWMQAHLGSHRLQHRICDSHLVHNSTANRSVETRLAASFARV